MCASIPGATGPAPSPAAGAGTTAVAAAAGGGGNPTLLQSRPPKKESAPKEDRLVVSWRRVSAGSSRFIHCDCLSILSRFDRGHQVHISTCQCQKALRKESAVFLMCSELHEILRQINAESTLLYPAAEACMFIRTWISGTINHIQSQNMWFDTRSSSCKIQTTCKQIWTGDTFEVSSSYCR